MSSGFVSRLAMRQVNRWQPAPTPGKIAKFFSHQRSGLESRMWFAIFMQQSFNFEPNPA
jgi:hypothetical protein